MIGDLTVVLVLAACVVAARAAAKWRGRRITRRLADERRDWAEWCSYRDAIRGWPS